MYNHDCVQPPRPRPWHSTFGLRALQRVAAPDSGADLKDNLLQKLEQLALEMPHCREYDQKQCSACARPPIKTMTERYKVPGRRPCNHACEIRILVDVATMKTGIYSLLQMNIPELRATKVDES